MIQPETGLLLRDIRAKIITGQRERPNTHSLLAGKGEGPTLKSAFTLETCSLRLVYHGTLLFAIGMTEIYQLDYFVICNPYGCCGRSFAEYAERTVFSMGKTGRTGSRYPRTVEQRQRLNAYLRQYRAEHPERVKRWRDNYIKRRAEKLLAAEQAGEPDAG